MLSVCLLVGLMTACEEPTPSPTALTPETETRLQVIGWGYVKLRPDASTHQRLTARQRAQRLAAANLAAQMAGSRFTYERRNTPPASITQLTLTTQAHIKQPRIEYRDVGELGVMVRQIAEVAVRQTDINQAFTYSADLHVANVTNAEAILYRQAVEKAVESRIPDRGNITGTLYLTDFSISSAHPKPGLTLQATVLVLFDSPPS